MIRLARLLVLAAAASRVVARHPRGPTLASLPACAINCVPTPCPDERLRAESDLCVQASCSFSDALYTQRLIHTACNSPIRDRSHSFKAMNLSLGCLTAVFVTLRFLSRLLFGPRCSLAPDDKVTLLVAAVAVAGMVINMVGLAHHGLGRDVWTLSPEDIPEFMRYLFAAEILYVVLVMLIKLSFSFFYLDLFPGSAFRRMIWATIAFHTCFCIAFVLVICFQCRPLQLYWTRFDTNSHQNGHCINANAAAWANGLVNILADVWLMTIPLSSLYRLELPWKKKVNAAIMFMTGFLVTVISMIRLRSLAYFANSDNPTWDHWGVLFWSTIEVNIGIICTCLPSVRLILGHVFPRTIGNNLGLPGCRREPAPVFIAPRRPDRTDQLDIELSSDFMDSLAVTRSIKLSEMSDSVRTCGSEEALTRPLPIKTSHASGLSHQTGDMF